MDIHPSTYFYTYRFYKSHLKQLVKARTPRALLSFSLENDSRMKSAHQFVLRPPILFGMELDLDDWSLMYKVMMEYNRFAGKYDNIFIKWKHQLDSLSWEALLWMEKDFGSQTEILLHPIEVLIHQEQGLWQPGLPPLIT